MNPPEFSTARMPDSGSDPGNAATEVQPRGVLGLLTEIRAGRTDPKSIGVDERRRCVMHLGAEGVSVPEIAGLLQTSERTIARDRQAIREEQALEPDPQLSGLMAGRLVAEAETCIARIRRVTRDKEAPHTARIDGERAVFDILDRMTQRLQSLGLLPVSVQRLEASLTHRLEGEVSLAEIEAEAGRLKVIEQQSLASNANASAPSEETDVSTGGTA